MSPRTSPRYVIETHALRRIANSQECRWRFLRHALERMAERKITAADVERVIKHGRIVFHELKQDDVYRVQGRDVDGLEMQVSVAFYETEILIKVITAF
jgi:1,6-anhydro-N-acetylmuramate kinase